MTFRGSARLVIISDPNLSCSAATDSSVVSCVVHVVKEALRIVSHVPVHGLVHPYHSKDPGVIVGVSPTLRLLDFFAFFS
jgi:hypothetical protein